jgi:hypothetical protein
MPSAASQLDHFFGEDGTSKGCDKALHFRSGMKWPGFGLARIYTRSRERLKQNRKQKRILSDSGGRQRRGSPMLDIMDLDPVPPFLIS